MDHPTRRIDSGQTTYDPGAAWVNRGMWLPPHARVMLSVGYTAADGWNWASVTLSGAPDLLGEQDRYQFRLTGAICTDLFLAVTTPLYEASEEWSKPRLFPM